MEFTDDQTSSRIILDEGTEHETVLTKCDQCKQMWKERNERGIEGGPPCISCRVDLLPENHDAAQIYMATRGQVITRNKGMEVDMVTDISIPAVESAMRIFNVKDQADCLQKVRRTFYAMLKEGNE